MLPFNNYRIIRLFILMAFLIGTNIIYCQELFVVTDPASNVPAKALSFRINNHLMPMAPVNGGSVEKLSYRLSTDLIYGIHKKLMVKVSGYASNMFQPAFKAEGISLAAKYRFFSLDNFHRHFRMAAFAKGSYSSNPPQMKSTVLHSYPDGNGGSNTHEINTLHGADEIMLEGNVSGLQLGVVATQLIQKLAFSGTFSYLKRLEGNEVYSPVNAQSAFQYTFSTGYLLFPRHYDNFKQSNLNLYAEFIGQSTIEKPVLFIDFAPSVQFIIQSKARVDFSYRFQLGGSMTRFNQEQWLLRFEYNWLQAFKGKAKKR